MLLHILHKYGKSLWLIRTRPGKFAKSCYFVFVPTIKTQQAVPCKLAMQTAAKKQQLVWKNNRRDMQYLKLLIIF